MTKEDAVKKYGLKSENFNPSAIFKGRDYRNVNHPYFHDASHYGELQFFVQFTRFESGRCGNGLYSYLTPRMTCSEALDIVKEMRPSFDNPGRHPFNSMNIIGVDENGVTFSAKDW